MGLMNYFHVEISGSHGDQYDVSPCSVVEIDRRFTSACYHHIRNFIALMMEAASTSQTSVSFSQTARRKLPRKQSYF
jgi:hypothetical protein